MPHVAGLRSPHAKVGRIVVFGRTLDKIRLHARGALPADYQANLGETRHALFDARCCRFLGLPYVELRARTLKGGCDEEILAWAHARGTPRTDEDCLIWNAFLTKIGWRDDRTSVLLERCVDYGFARDRALTFCELLDIDEGRPPGGTRSWEGPALSVVVVMGVSGCGKTTVGRGLAEALRWGFLEADELHSAENIERMSRGTALTDSDRAPWLAAVRSGIEASVSRGSSLVVACSALKDAYRRVLAPDPGNIRFAYLRGDYPLIARRLEGRAGHFMKEGLLRSQFEALEEPEDALALDAAGAPDVSINRIRDVLGLR